MRKLCLFLSLVLMAAVEAAHTVASGGKALMQIVYEPCARVEVQRYDHVFKRKNTPDVAAGELAEFLKKMTGAEFLVLKEADWDDETPAFLIGDTAFARKNGIDVPGFKSEEWLYRTCGKNIVIAGGEDWGNNLAVAKFAEDVLHCRWLAWDALIIPEMSELVIDEVSRRGEPDFRQRAIYIPPTGQKSERIAKDMYRWLRFNRSNFQRYQLISSNQYPGLHSFYHFVSPEEYFKTHPEYFTMNDQGKRICGTTESRSGGQLCLSNPDVLKITVEKLREYIAADRKNAPRELWPVLYDISQCDSTDYICKCSDCLKIAAEEGGDSGLLIRFMNQVSEAISQDYPEIFLRTFAYVSTEKVPLKVRPADNVILQWCDLYFHSDCFRPLNHPVNVKQKAILDAWKARGIAIDEIWDYWNMGGSYVGIPRIETVIMAIPSDLRYFKACGTKDLFIESEHCLYNVDTNFIELQWYLGLQLMDDLSKDENQLIGEFMRFYYGPAETTMKAVLDTINAAVASEPKLMGYSGTLVQSFLNRALVQELEGLLNKAIEETAPGTAYRARVERECLPVLRSMAYFDALRGNLSKAEALEKYREFWTRNLNYVYTAEELPEVLPFMEKALDDLAFDFKTPEKFASIPAGDIRKFCFRDFSGGIRVNDPDAVLGTAVKIGNPNKDKTERIYASEDEKDCKTKNIIGLSNMTEKKELWFNSALEKPQDEKYHWYCMRNQKFGPKTVFWGWSWWTMCDMSKVYMDGASNLWDVWFSLKKTGPVFVNGSQSENGLFVDCVVLTPPGAIK